MSDLFHEDIPLDFIQKIFGIMNKASWHTFHVLTKRAERLEELAPYLNWSPNIWQGVTVKSDQYKYRIDSMRKVNAKVRFISFEPLIDEVKNLDLTGVDWAIVGGESGFKSRRMDPEWVLSIKNECDQQGVSFYTMGWDKQKEKWSIIAWANLGFYAGNRGQITDNAAPDPNKSTQINMHAFADKPYYGNPAEVCFLPQQVTDVWMQNISREMF